MKFSVKLLIALIALGLVYGPAVSAESLDQFSAEEDLLFQEIESVYAASKYEQKVSEAPSKISIITAEEIQRYGYRTLENALKSLPGFYSSYDRNYAYVGVRGFGSPGDYDTKLLMLIDGHRLNDNVFDTMYSDHGFILDLDLIERIEVVRGPGSSLYGSSAFFAVINIITRQGRSMQGIELSASGGSYDTYSGRVSYGKRYNNGMELLLSGTYYTSDGQSSLYYEEYDFPETNNGIAQDADDTEHGSFFGKLSYKDFTLTGAYVEMEKGVPTGAWEVEFNDKRNRTWDGQAYINLKYQRALSSTLEITGRVSYNWSWFTGDYVLDYGSETESDIVINTDDVEGEWFGAEIQTTWDFHEKHRLVSGGEYRGSTKQSQRNYDIYGDYLDINSDIDNWGLFIQDEFNATDSLDFYLGARYDDSSSFEGEISPRVAAIYSPLEKAAFKLIYGTAFRGPNAYELFYEDGGESQKTNPNLQPETIETLELIAEYRFSTNIRLAASLFHNSIDDLIVYVEDPEDELLYFDNLGTAEANGVELELFGRWANGWNTTLSYTYQDAEDGDGNWLVNSPKNMLKFNLMFPLLAEELLAGALEFQYMSERLTLGGNETDDSFVTNLVFLSRNLLNGLTISAGVYNIFDEDYFYPVSDAHEQDSILQDGRTYRIKIDYTF
jgi:iron complex outermembrane receptor protein